MYCKLKKGNPKQACFITLFYYLLNFYLQTKICCSIKDWYKETDILWGEKNAACRRSSFVLVRRTGWRERLEIHPRECSLWQTEPPGTKWKQARLLRNLQIIMEHNWTRRGRFGLQHQKPKKCDEKDFHLLVLNYNVSSASPRD